eukprot:12455611-Prorocentrum_lima.AAC.1
MIQTSVHQAKPEVKHEPDLALDRKGLYKPKCMLEVMPDSGELFLRPMNQEGCIDSWNKEEHG